MSQCSFLKISQTVEKLVCSHAQTDRRNFDLISFFEYKEGKWAKINTNNYI